MNVIERSLIPTLDPNPLPAPYGVFKLLLLVTFYLHILAMNAMLGSAVLALIAKFGGRKTEQNRRMIGELARKLPSLLPATITLGIAPLLFVQMLYGQFFYTSSAIVAWPWFLVLVFLTIAYYGFYYASFQYGRQPGRAANVLLGSALLVLCIGFIYSNNLTLLQAPSRWREKYFANPAGWNLNLSEPTLVPRFLHFFVAAVAVGGFVLVFLAAARWRRDANQARHLFQFGGKAFMYATMAQFLVGIWFLTSLPQPLRMLFLGGNAVATALLVVGGASGFAAIFVMSAALYKEDVRLAAYYVSSLTGTTILCMIVMRDILRDAYLKPYFDFQHFVVKTQWSVFPLFLTLFVAGVFLWLVMLKRYGMFAGTRDASSRSSPSARQT